MRLRTLATLAATAVAALVIAPAANADVENGHTYRITTRASLALDVEGSSPYNGARVIQWPLNGGDNQKWRIEPSGNMGYSLIRNVSSGKCLTMPAPFSAGVGLVQLTCNPGAEYQQWAVDPDRIVGGFLLYNGLQNGQAVDVPGGTIGWGTQLIGWPFHHGENQTFFFTRLD